MPDLHSAAPRPMRWPGRLGIHLALRPLVVVLGVAAVMMGSVPAALTAPLPSVTVSPNSGAPGSLATVTGAHFDHKEMVDLLFDSTLLTTVQAGNGGDLPSTPVTVPILAPPGDHVVMGIGQSSGKVGQDTFTVQLPSASLTVSPTSGVPGSVTAASGSNFAPFEKVVIAFDGATAGSATAGSLGSFSGASVAVPITAIVGSHTVKGTGQVSGLVGQATFTVPAPTLAATPASGPPGTVVQTSGTSFGASETVAIDFDATLVGTATTTGGAFSSTIAVPSNAVSGAHVIVATGQSSGLSAQAAFTVQSLLPPSGALFGAYVAVGDHTGTTHQLAMTGFEAEVGRQMAIDKQTYAWSDVWPAAYEFWSRDQGRTLSFEWNAEEWGGTVIPWADIASGKYDAAIDTKAAGIKAFGAPAFFVFHHEPESEVGKAGTVQDFINAYRHVHDRFAADGVTNLTYGLVLLSTTYASGNADQYYPGDGYVDILGADGYNWYRCPGRNDPWTSFHDVFTGFYSYGVGKGKPMFVYEWGSNEDSMTPGRKGQWITDAAVTLKTWPQVKAVAYYHNGPPAPICPWWVDSSPSSLAAFQGMGADAFFNPPRAPPAPTSVSAYVSVLDSSFGTPVGTLVQGKGVEWLFTGSNNHTVTDSSGMGLFDSGTKAPGATYLFTFVAAGIYNYKDTLHPTMTGTLRIPLTVSPLSGGLSTRFTITWASGAGPPGYVFDVQIQRPGSSTWVNLLSNQTALSATFIPDGGVGTYSFRSRIRNTANAMSSWYSMTVAITVS